MSINDVAQYFLKGHISTELILQKEIEMRTAIKYETEVSTLFDFVMYYIKIWKISCQDRFREASQPYLDDVYNFFGEIEALAYDLSKSVLIDAHSLQFKVRVRTDDSCALLSSDVPLHHLPARRLRACQRSPCRRLFWALLCASWMDCCGRPLSPSRARCARAIL